MKLSGQRVKSKAALATADMAVFAMLGAIMFATKKAMEGLPNIHLIGMFIMAFTLVYRKKALIPLYVYVMLDGLVGGFGLWWLPYLYIWAVLWGITMLLPENLPPKVGYVVYPVICSLFGLSFGTLYAPAQALIFGLNFKGMIAWIVAGFPFDALHAAGNFVTGFLILPLATLLKKLESKKSRL